MGSRFKKTDGPTIAVPMIAAMAVAPCRACQLRQLAPQRCWLAQLGQELAGWPELRLRATGDQIRWSP